MYLKPEGKPRWPYTMVTSADSFFDFTKVRRKGMAVHTNKIDLVFLDELTDYPGREESPAQVHQILPQQARLASCAALSSPLARSPLLAFLPPSASVAKAIHHTQKKLAEVRTPISVAESNS